MMDANLNDIEKHLRKSAKQELEQLDSGYNESLRLLGRRICMNRVAYSFFFILPPWLSENGSGEKSTELLHKHGAYIIYKTQVDDDMQASFTLAMMGHYSAAETILRTCLELLCRGAFYDGIAKASLRKGCRLIHKRTRNEIDGEKRSIWGLFDELLRHDSDLFDRFEENSGGILDKLSPFMDGKPYRTMFPNFRETVEQLSAWGHFRPIADPTDLIYEGYRLLSQPVHGSIGSLDIGRRMMNGENLFELPKVNGPHLEHYLTHFGQLLDVGLVLTLNLMASDPAVPGTKTTLCRVMSHMFYDEIEIPCFRQRVTELMSDQRDSA